MKNKKLVGLLISVSLLLCCIISLTIKSTPKQTNEENIVDLGESKDIQSDRNEDQNQNDIPKTDDKDKVIEKKDNKKENSSLSSNLSQAPKNNHKNNQKNPEQTNKTNNETVHKDNHYVTLYIDCKTILNNMDQLPSKYKQFVPSNGIILSNQKVILNEGDTVFDVILRVTKQKRISLVQKQGYIQSIHSIPEKIFDGSGGWMYSVNGKYANVGCKEYKLKNNDKIAWRYTCFIGDLY